MTEIRLIATESEQRASQHLGLLAFGGDLAAPFDPSQFNDSALRFGAFDGDRLAAKLTIRPYEQVFGGQPVSMGGIAGVAVAPEDRGRGLAQQLLQAAIERMHVDGQVISTLYQTAMGLYRTMGWELGGSMPSVAVRTVDLARARGGDEVTIRACTEADVESVGSLYASYIRERNGMLTRTGPSFPAGPKGVLGLDGVPLAVRAGAIVGYASYSRGSGYGPESQLRVHDLVGADAGAIAALLRHLSTWSSVAAASTFRWSADDAAGLLLPDALAAPVEERRWMLRLVDLAGAMAGRGWPRGVNLTVDLEVRDEQAEWNEGTWQLNVADGKAEVREGGAGNVRCTIHALASLYTGAFDARTLMRAGTLSAAEGDLDTLDLMFAGPPSTMWDYF